MNHIITLYYIPRNPQCRAVLLTGAALNINFDLKDMESSIGDQYPAELREINPLHTVPAIKDGEFSLWDGRIISTYLAEKYDKRVEFNLFPNDPEIRATINLKLYSTMVALSTSLFSYYYPFIFRNEDFNPTHYQKIEEAFRNFNTLLESRDKLGEENLYLAADWLTIADLHLAAVVETFITCYFPIEAYPFVEKWYNTVRKMPNFEEANIIPLRQFKYYFETQVRARLASEEIEELGKTEE